MRLLGTALALLFSLTSAFAQLGPGVGAPGYSNSAIGPGSNSVSAIGPPAGGGVASLPIRQLATRSTVFNNSSGAATTQFMARSRHIARTNITSLAIVIPTWYVSHSTLSEVALGTTETVHASVEYPAGVCTELKWSGAAQPTLPDNTNNVSDQLTLAIPNGSAFFIRVWGSTTGGLLSNAPGGVASSLGFNASRDSTNGEAIQYSFGGNVTDRTLSCDTITSTDVATGWAPAAIVGPSSADAYFLWGDSRVYGLADSYNDSSTNVGEAARVVGPTYAYINDGVPAQSATNWNGVKTTTRQKELAALYTNVLFSQMGYNDVGSFTGAQTLSTLQTVWAASFPTISKIWAVTFPPGTTSTDGWATTANQTASSNNTNRLAFNALARAGIAGTLGTVDYAAVAESSLNSGKWTIPSLCQPTGNTQTTTTLTVGSSAAPCTIGPGTVFTGATGFIYEEVNANGTGTGGAGTYTVSRSQSLASSTLNIRTSTVDGIHEPNIFNQVYVTAKVFPPSAGQPIAFTPLTSTSFPNVNAGAHTALQWERTQAWTGIAKINIPAPPAGGGAAIIFTTCNQGLNQTLFTGYEFWIENQSSKGVLRVRIISNYNSGAGPYIGVSGTTNVTDGVPHYVAATYDGSGTAAGVKLYVDGVLETMSTESDTLGANSIVNQQPFIIGNQMQFAYSLGGTMAEFMLSNVVRSASWISSYQTAATSVDANTVLAYQFAENSGKTVADLSSNGFTGAVNGAVWQPSGVAGTAPHSVQWAIGPDTGASALSSNAAVFTNTVTSGDSVIGACVCACTNTPQVTDDKSNTYTIVNTNTSLAGVKFWYYYLLNATNAPKTITCSLNTGTGTFWRNVVSDVNNIATSAALDGNSDNYQASSGTGNNVVTSGNFTPSVNADYIFGVANSYNSVFNQSGQGFSAVQNSPTTANEPMWLEETFQLTAAQIAATFTPTATNQGHTAGMAFKTQ